MSFTPAVPLSGLAGYRFLENTKETQIATLTNSPEIKRNIEYFKENIGNVTSAEDLVADRQLLTVVMASYGLADETYKTAFIRRILDEGVEDRDSLGFRLNNKDYKEMATDLKLDTDNPRTGWLTVQDKIVSNYIEQTYETAVGDQDISLRQALDFKRQAAETSQSEGGWFSFMGDASMRDVLQTALNLPSDIAALDIDKQNELFETRALSILGSKDASVLNDPAVIDKVVSRYLLINQARSGASSFNPALVLLGNISSGFGPSASQSLFNSSF